VHTPEWEGWEGMVNTMLDRMAEDGAAGEEELSASSPPANSLQKVVLARRSECLLRCGGMDAADDEEAWQVDPLSLLSSLQASNPTAYHFCLQVLEPASRSPLSSRLSVRGRL
jgi:isochorismate synthase EntC